MALFRKIKYSCLLLPFFLFFCFSSTVSAQENKRTFTDKTTNISFSFPISAEDKYFFIIRKESCYSSDNHSEGIDYFVYSSKDVFQLKSTQTWYSLFSSIDAYNYSIVQFRFKDNQFPACGVYDNLEYLQTQSYENVTDNIRLDKNDYTKIVYNNFDIKNTSGNIIYEENISSGNIDDGTTEEPKPPTKDDIFETLKSWLVPTQEEVKGLFDLIQTDFENKFPIINEIGDAFDFVKSTPDEISQMGSAEGFSSMLEFEFAGHKFDFLSGIVTDNDITSFIRGFVSMTFFVITLWIFIHELPEIVKG